MRKLLEWLGMGHKMTVIMSWHVSGASVETIRKLLKVANEIAEEKEPKVHVE